MRKNYGFAIAPEGSAPASGQFAFACEGDSFAGAHLATGLTNYAIGIPATGPMAALDQIVPAIKTPRSFTNFVQTVGEQLVVEEGMDERAAGAQFAEITGTGSQQPGKTKNKGLTFTLDADQLVAGKDRQIVRSLIWLLSTLEFLRVRTLLESMVSSTAVVWDGADPTIPDIDLARGIKRSGDAVGVDANTMLIGGSGWISRMAYYSGENRNPALAMFTPAQLAESLGLDRCVKVNARKRAAKGQALADTVGSVAYLFHQAMEAPEFDASAIKRFVTPPDVNAEEIGGQLDGNYAVYQRVWGKLVSITVEHYSDIVKGLAGTGAVQKLAIT